MERIAREMDAKYGNAYGSGRGKSKKDDHCDIGLGYDESDSFIDNTEAVGLLINECSCFYLFFINIYNFSMMKSFLMRWRQLREDFI